MTKTVKQVPKSGSRHDVGDRCGESGPGTTAASSADRACRPAVGEEPLADLARVAKALSDPIRLRMLEMMSQGRGCCGLQEPAARGVPGQGEPQGICVCEFQERFGLGQSKTSYHLRVLRDAGLVTEEARGKWAFYAVDRASVERAQTALGALFGS
jgi:ArsR family transcriptional regulator, arsenate/arsenite/antimonite-responsive transcriptional repressor